MTTLLATSDFYASANIRPLDLAQLQSRAPAVFATAAAQRTSPKYTFISTRTLVDALLDAGFVATGASQTRSRRGDGEGFGRHMLRFQQPRESVTLVDAIPQLTLLNAHDGSSSYELRAGLYRPICTNGLLTSLGDFGLIRVPHRGEVVRNVVEAAHTLIRNFSRIGEVVQRMAATCLTQAQRLAFAGDALAIRYPHSEQRRIIPEQLIAARRSEDAAPTVWATFNTVQENVMQGGLTGVTPTGRSVRTRPIHAIREDVRINNALWQLATNLLPA